jgi:citrate synthase
LTGKDTMADLAIALEEAALADEYFSSRKLYPNVDYWTAIIFNSLKFPPGNLFFFCYTC